VDARSRAQMSWLKDARVSFWPSLKYLNKYLTPALVIVVHSEGQQVDVMKDDAVPFLPILQCHRESDVKEGSAIELDRKRLLCQQRV
jgi:hypothetical protein